MSSIKKVGVTLRLMEEMLYKELRDSLSNDWTLFLNKMGLMPVLIPNCLKDPVEYFISSGCEALILTNGENVKLVKKGNNEFSGTRRDVTEAKLFKYSLENSIPVIGVCRGMQFINVYFGGKLTEGIEGHVTESHQLEIISGRYKGSFGADIITNSYHNVGVLLNDVAENLTPWAVKECVVEAVHHVKYPVVAIQWHPERKNPSWEVDMKLFDMVLKRKFLTCF